MRTMFAAMLLVWGLMMQIKGVPGWLSTNQLGALLPIAITAFMIGVIAYEIGAMLQFWHQSTRKIPAQNCRSKLPCANQDGLIQTLNHRGWMMTAIDPYCLQFVEFSAKANNWVLDAGCAFGVHTLAAVTKGAKVIANDLDTNHLEILEQSIAPNQGANLRTICGAFPDIDIADSSLAAILAARVFHFFDGAALERAAAKMFKMLAPGGKVFITADSPYLGTLKEFLPEYERRNAAFEKWPGLIEDMSVYEPNEVAEGLIPKTMHFLDPEVLFRTFKGAGFLVETAEFFARSEGFSGFLRLDGREGVALIARKPQTDNYSNASD